MVIEPVHSSGRRLRNLERLRAYVSGAKASGHSKSEVKRQLSQLGWQPQNIDAAWPADELNPKRHAFALLILLGVLLVVVLLIRQPASITGAFFSGGGAEWEFLSEVNATNAEQQVSASVPFGVFRPLVCTDGILLRHNNTNVSFATSDEVLTNGRCTSTTITFDNAIFDNATNVTSTATYQIYNGKVEQIAEFISPTPADGAQLNGTEISIWAVLALPGVTSLEWNSANETMIGNGTTWWSTKTNLTPGNYSAQVFTTGAHTEKRIFTILAPQQQEQNQTQNQTNQTPMTQSITFVSPTPANGSTATTNQLSFGVELALPAGTNPMLRTIFGRDTSNNGTWTNYTMDGSAKSWTKNLILANGRYEIQAFEGNTSSEIRMFAVDYSPPLVKSAALTFAAQGPESIDGSVTFTATVKNTGNATIDSLAGKVNVFDKDNLLITAVNLSTASALGAGNSQSLTASWQAASVGRYKSTAVVKYDGKEEQATADFTVGAKTLEITKSNAIQSGDEVEFLIGLKNKWIEDITATAEIKISKDGVALDSVKSEAVAVPAANEKAISVKWSSAGRDIKSLDSEITVTYGDKSASTKIAAQKPAEEVKASEEVQASAEAGQQAENKTTSITGALVAAVSGENKAAAILVIVVLGAALGALFYFTKFRPPEPPGGGEAQRTRSLAPGMEEEGPVKPLQPQTAQPQQRAQTWDEYVKQYYEYYYPDYYKKWKEYTELARQRQRK